MKAQGKEIQDGRFVDVLVVDDDVEAVQELVEFLSKANLKCVSANDGWAALQLLADGYRPSVVLSDLRMPELDGMEFAQRLADVTGAERPEIIFISGNAGFDDAIAAIRLGARDMLAKPIDGPKLVQTVKSAQIARQLKQRPPEATPPATATSGRPAEQPLTATKREALNDMKSMRRLRSQHFPSDLFSDPCWEMLLDLYDAHLAGAEVTVTSLGAASGVPQTTALRRMETLQGHGLINRVEDKDDRRRTIIKLTDPGLAAVERFFETYLTRRSARSNT
ncbi:MAG TPA: response regulator [Reyranella sp.]|nr:response regulator [Reyranella sp.]